jgi:hypothetical protein
MGLNPAAVNRMLHGQRNIMAEEIPIIEDYLGVKLALGPGQARAPRGFGEAGRQEHFAPPDAAQPPLVPVYKTGAALGEAVDWVPRHPAQFGIQGAFAVYVFSDEMEPRYFRGEIAYIHPGRPPEAGRDCLIALKEGGTIVRRLIREDKAKIRVAQYAPKSERDIARKDIKAVYLVVGRG